MEQAERTDITGTDTLVRRVRVWAMGRGLIAVPGAVDAIMAAKRCRDADPDALHRWTVRDVEELLWVGVVRSCQATGTPLPPEATETLWSYLGYLGEHGLFAPGSDPLPALLTPLQMYGGLNRFGRRRPVRLTRPARSRRSTPGAHASHASQAARGASEPGLATIIPFRPRSQLRQRADA